MKSGLWGATLGVVVSVVSAGCSGASNNSPITSPPVGDDGGATFDATAGGAALSLSAATQNFGTLAVGQIGPPLLITATNTGNAQSGKMTVMLGGMNADSFVVDKDDCTGQVLASGSNCAVKMHFAPMTAGGLSASLAFSDDLGNSASAALTGTATVPPDVALLPKAEDFGTVQIAGSSAPTTFTLANNGMADVGIVTVALGGMDLAQFTTSMDGCSGKPLVAGMRCSVAVTFAPMSAGAKTATLSASIAGGPTRTSALSGLGASGAAFSVTAGSSMPVMSYDFGSVTTGHMATQSFTVTNTGGMPSGIPAVTMSGPNMGDFAVSMSTCTAALMPNGTCSFSVAFTPGTTAAESAALGVSAPQTTPASVALNGTGLAPAAVQPNPSTFDFGSVVQGGKSAVETFTFTNNGSATSGALMVSLNGSNQDQFTLGNDTCAGAQLAGGDSCTVDVTFTPDASASGTLSAQLTVTGNPGGSVSASLSGTSATLAKLSIGPAPYDYGNVAQSVATSPVTFTVTNAGTLASGSPKVTMGGANPDDFTIVADGCTGFPVAGNNGTCTISVAFKPSTQAQESAILTVAASPGGAATTNLSGTGTQAAALQITPNPAGFGDVVQNVQSGNKTFTISNTGGVPSGTVAVSMGGANGGDFHVVTNNCKDKTLPPNGATACTVIVAFKPSVLGKETATLTAIANPGGTATDAVTGNGVTQGTLAVTPNPGAFGGVNQGTTSPKITFQVSNNGGAPSGVPTVSVTGANMGDFKLGTNTCTAAIPPNTTNACQIDVTFKPGTTMAESATLNIAASPGGTTVPLTGTGTQPAIAITTPMGGSWTCNALPGHTTTQPFTVTNNGTGSTGGLTLSGLPSNGFSVMSDQCSGMMLGAGGTCSFNVQYAPPLTETIGQSDVASVVVTDTTTDKATGSLHGKALASGVNLQMSSTPSSASYSGSGASVTFTVQNWGIAASGSLGTPTVTAMQSAPTAADISSDFMIANNHCSGMTLAPAQSCSYDVVFTAAESGGSGDGGSGDGGSGDGGTIGGMFTGFTTVGDGANSAFDNFSGAGY